MKKGAYHEYNDPVSLWIDRKLSERVAKRAEEYVNRFARSEDGSENPLLAELIRYEVHRRGFMGRELDVFEPARWAGYSAVLSFLAGIGIHQLMGGKDIRKSMITGLLSGTAGAAIALSRSMIRYDAGLYGGAQTAVGMWEYRQKHPLPEVIACENGEVAGMDSALQLPIPGHASLANWRGRISAERQTSHFREKGA